MSVIGIDPGSTGALANYDYRTGALTVTDIPAWHMPVGKKVRKRIDAVALLEYFEVQKMAGAQLVMIEAVGARPRQSGMFVFGYGVGLIYMACIACKLPIETVSPTVWKKIMRVPGKRESKKEGKNDKEHEAAIMSRTYECFPDYRGIFIGPKGGNKVDRAEASLLAKYAADYALGSTKTVDIRDPEWYLAYQQADTGA